MSKIYIFLLFISVPFFGKAQDTINFVDLDQQTAQYYFSSQWDSVISVGKVGLKNGHDYFYLRLRMGVAYFYQGKFTKAITQLEKARSFNDQDDFTNSYLYLSYKYAGRPADAEVLERKLSDTLKKQPLFKKTPLFSGTYLEFGFSPASNYNPTPIPFGNTTNFYESSTKNNALKYGFVGLTNQITPWLSIFYGYTSLSTSATKYAYEKQLPPLMPKLNTTISDILVSQNQFYLNPRIRLAKGLILATYYHKINNTSVLKKGSTNSTDTTLTFNDGILGVSLEKYFRNFVFVGEISNNKLNNTNHLQTSIAATWFPLSNLNFYLSTMYCSNNAKGPASKFPANYDKSKTFYMMKIGGKLKGKLWGEAAYYGGNIQDSQLANGFLVFSSPNKFTMMTNATLMLVFNKIKVSLKYQYSNLSSTKTFTKITSQNQLEYSNFTFSQQTITGGLLWNF
jgi:tetratricopeptide (TPR) repeat protein